MGLNWCTTYCHRLERVRSPCSIDLSARYAWYLAWLLNSKYYNYIVSRAMTSVKSTSSDLTKNISDEKLFEASR